MNWQDLIPQSLRWTPPAPDPDLKYKEAARRLVGQALEDEILDGRPVQPGQIKTWQQLKAEDEAQAKQKAELGASIDARNKAEVELAQITAKLEKTKKEYAAWRAEDFRRRVEARAEERARKKGRPMTPADRSWAASKVHKEDRKANG